MHTCTINRRKPFDPAKFIGEGWMIWRGPANSDGLTGEEQQCAASLALREIDLSKVLLVTRLMGSETFMVGEELLSRLKTGTSIMLDAKIGQTLLQNPHLIPDSWKGKEVYFIGSVLRQPNGDRCVLCLYWDEGTEMRWKWRCTWLESELTDDDPVAVLVR